MGKAGKIRPQQIKKAQRLISDLPVKDESCSREEAAALLEKDLKRAFKKGYSPKEICALFKKEGIIIARHLVEKYLDEEDGQDKEARTVLPDSKAPSAEKSFLDSEKDANFSSAFDGGEADKSDHTFNAFNQEAATQSSNLHDDAYLAPGAFRIVPDTPIGEL